MVPEAAVQDTPELKLPVPETVAEHWLVWLICKLVGAQETATEVTAGDCIRFEIEPPPQPAISNTPKKKRLNTAFRTIIISALSYTKKAHGCRQDESCSSLRPDADSVYAKAFFFT